LQGDPPELIPEDDPIPRCVRAYLAKLPNLSEGQGSDDVAYGFAAFLVRDLALPDADALPWLEEWGGGNRPPKGRERLQEILANAQSYGQRAYGSGLNGTPSTNGTAVSNTPPAPPAPEEPKTGFKTILEEFRRRYEPKFRRGTSIYSETLGREVKANEAC